MKEQFVTYDIALKLKEKGFDEQCLATVDQTEFLHINGTKYPIRGAMVYFQKPAPLWQQVFDWLSNVHNIHIGICHQSNGMFDIWKNNGNLLLSGAEYKEFKTYSEARQAAIERALTLI